jgi:ATP/maltotriose-dependent transcriptional regulator MalT/DNA-binding SARP family transcriptional activator
VEAHQRVLRCALRSKKECKELLLGECAICMNRKNDGLVPRLTCTRWLTWVTYCRICEDVLWNSGTPMAAKPGFRPSIPLLPSAMIERPRLLNSLQAVFQHKLTIITAPPGYGKTTLAAQFARQAEAPVVWQTVEELDRDTPNLYAHTLAALAEVATGIQELPFHPRHTASELALRLTDDLREHLSDDILYVLDDAHHLVGTPASEAWLRTLVAALPARCHLLLISRVLPNIPLTEMIARREVLALGQAQLRFTTDEITQLAATVSVDRDAFAARSLTARLDGWPAGVILALQPLPAEFEQALLAGESSPEALFFDLAHHMLRSQSPAMQRFLLVSSTLTRMTPDLCEHALQLPGSAAYLAEALRRSLFAHQVSGGVIYHALFRDFLQRQLQQSSPSEFTDLHRRAGAWFEANQRLDEAFMHYIAGDLSSRAAGIAQQAAQAYFAQGKVETLLAWSRQLAEINIMAPQLHHACARIQVERYQYDLALAELAKAEEGFHYSGDKIGHCQVELLLGCIENQRGQFQHAIQRARWLLCDPELPSHLRGDVLVTLGFAVLQLGDAQAALEHLEVAVPLHRAVGDAYAISQVLQYLELAYIRLGRFEEAGVCLQEIVAIRRSVGSVLWLALALNDLGYYCHQTGDYRRAFQTFQEGLSLVSRFPQRRVESVLLWSLGDLQRDRGAFGEAVQYYRRSLEQVSDGEPALRCGLLNSLATLRRWQGKLVEAVSCAEEALRVAHQYHLALEQAKAEMTLWVTRAQGESLRDAEAKLQALARSLRQQQSSARLAQTWGLCAYLALLREDKVKALRYFQWIDRTLSQPANLQLLLTEIHHTPLLKAFIEARAARHPALMEGLLRLREAQVEATEAARRHLETPLSTLSLHVWTLGQEKVERDGSPVPIASWRMMARELFFYLLLRGATSREQTCLDFWPEGTPQQVNRNFHTTLYRLRQALGENAIIFRDEQYWMNPDLDLACDAFEFEALVQEARLLAPRTAHAESLWQRAVGLYRGDFLPTMDREWVTAQREHLREVYLEALVGWGHCARARGEVTTAIGLYKQAAQVDSYREDIHRLILMAYAEQGERKQILKHYTELVTLLHQELAVEPSDETSELVQALLA